VTLSAVSALIFPQGRVLIERDVIYAEEFFQSCDASAIREDFMQMLQVSKFVGELSRGDLCGRFQILGAPNLKSFAVGEIASENFSSKLYSEQFCPDLG